MTQANEWEWWQNALAGKRGDIHDGDPQTGFYRARRKGRDSDSPIAYWRDSKTGDIRCHMDGADHDIQRALELWPYASKKPVTQEAYGERLRTGKWPDESAAVIGHNTSPVGDDKSDVADRIDDLAREAEKLIAAGAAANEETANQASDLANTFGELEGKADNLRIAEKAPHLEASRTVDAKWQPLIVRASDLKRRLKLIVVTPFLRVKAEEAQKASVTAISSGIAPEALPQTRITAGSSKRSTGLRTHTAAEITDWDALLAALKAHPEIRDTAQRIANASAKASVELPGTKITKTKVAA